MLSGTLLALHKAQPIREITFYIDTYYHQNITIEEISAQFFLSRKYMRNLFVRQIGHSPKQYLQKVRMEKAAALLKETEYDIGAIAISTGHSDVFAFSKAFKKYYGISPSQYRKQYGK